MQLQTAPSVSSASIEMKCRDLAVLEKQLDRKNKPIQKKIEALYEEQAAKVGDLPERIKALEDDIKRDCLLLGASVSTDTPYDVIFSDGRVTWDTKALDGYAVANKDIEQFRKQGKPSAKLVRKPE